MAEENDLYNFAIAYRNGPWEVFAQLKDKLAKQGLEIEELASRADDFLMRVIGSGKQHVLVMHQLLNMRKHGFVKLHTC